ncbi:MAG: lanthionine synthetase LanC family protein, partial [Candidatus Kariarchaeaceae archaeon]
MKRIQSGSKLLVLHLLVFMVAPITEVDSQAQFPDVTEFDDAKYYGYEYGAAGISYAMIEAIKVNILDEGSVNIVTSAVEFSLEQIWTNKIDYNGSQTFAWTKHSGIEFLSIYPGKKYGAAGIIPIFLEFYKLTNEIKWLERAEKGYWALADQASNNSDSPHWSYTYLLPADQDGIALSDIKYGSAGILELSLKLYEITNNEDYLNHAKKIVSWLDHISCNILLNDVEYNVFPWHSLGNCESTINLSYGWGIAGVAPLLYRLGELTNIVKYQDWAISLSNFIKNLQDSDGGWTTQYKGGIKATGFDEGVAGILYGLNQIKKMNSTDHFDNTIKSGINWLFTFYSNDKVSFGFNETSDRNQKYTSFNNGLIGILKSLVVLETFLNDDQMMSVIESYEWLITKGSFKIKVNETDMILLLQTTQNQVFVDFSLSEGLAGLLMELTKIIVIDRIRSDLNIDLSKIIVNTLNTIIYYQQPDGFWKRQTKIDPSWEIINIETNRSESSFIWGSMIYFAILVILVKK